jgi:hypothetical protein
MAMAHLRSFIPRNRLDAKPEYLFITDANISYGLVQEALMRLLYDGQVKRRRDGRGYVYWASPRLPPPSPVPVVLPDRLRHFMRPHFSMF